MKSNMLTLLTIQQVISICLGAKATDKLESILAKSVLRDSNGTVFKYAILLLKTYQKVTIYWLLINYYTTIIILLYM